MFGRLKLSASELQFSYFQKYYYQAFQLDSPLQSIAMSEVTGNNWQSPSVDNNGSQQSPTVQQPQTQNEGGLWATITSNPYFSAGFGLIGVGAGLTILRQGINVGAALLRRRLLVTLEIPSKDKSYLWFLQWMSQQSARRTQHLAVETSYKQHDNGSVSTTFGLVPGPGNHFFKWRGVWLQASRASSMETYCDLLLLTIICNRFKDKETER
jgi:hypothetical protein